MRSGTSNLETVVQPTSHRAGLDKALEAALFAGDPPELRALARIRLPTEVV
jgi:hypothetical protein